MKLYQLKNAESALAKLYNYNLLDPGTTFHIMAMRSKVISALESHAAAYNALLKKHGSSKDGKHYDIPAEKKDAFLKDLESLDNQEIDLLFPSDKITLCVESISKAEEGQPIDKRLCFNACDWAAIQEIIRVVECEE